MYGSMIGHNSEAATIEVEVRLFNSVSRFREGAGERRALTLALDGTIGDVIDQLGIPVNEIYLVLLNGRDITPDLGGRIRVDHPVEDGDVVAFSGPVPYSWGYGAPVI